MMASPTFTPTTPYRPGFDVALPPLLTPKSHGQVWAELPPMLPARKSIFISFQGVRTEGNEKVSWFVCVFVCVCVFACGFVCVCLHVFVWGYMCAFV